MRAIDIHVHPTDARVARAWAGEQADAERFFRGPWTHEDLDATAERFRSLDVLAVLSAPTFADPVLVWIASLVSAD